MNYEWKTASVRPPRKYHSSSLKTIPLLLAMPDYEYAVLGYYLGGLINKFRVNGSPSIWQPLAWAPCPKAPRGQV